MATKEPPPGLFPFTVPLKRVHTEPDIDKWVESDAYKDLVSFIQYLGKSVENKKVSAKCTESAGVKAVLASLEKLKVWVGEMPPEDQPQRFGNKAYRVWHAKLAESVPELITPLLHLSILRPDSLQPAVVELTPYLLESFGNTTRIDYGTGHEASFTIFLLCLMKLGVLSQADSQAIVTRIFSSYLALMRLLQRTYRMEPAGSQGVWGLDDFHFLPFIWGASQLIGQLEMTPDSFLDKNLCSTLAEDYLFFGCVDYIHTTKVGPFAEHSNVLWGISNVPEWGKVSTGLLKMYKSEVLCKFPVIQHMPFGSLFSFEKSPE